MDQIDQDVKEKDISRARWISTAIDTYLRLAGSNGGADPMLMHREMMQLRTDNERLWKGTQYLKITERDSALTRSNYATKSVPFKGRCIRHNRTTSFLIIDARFLNIGCQ